MAAESPQATKECGLGAYSPAVDRILIKNAINGNAQRTIQASSYKLKGDSGSSPE